MKDLRKYIFTFIPQLIILHEMVILKGELISGIFDLSEFNLIDWIILIVCLALFVTLLRMLKKHNIVRQQLEVRNKELRSMIEVQRSEFKELEKDLNRQNNLSEFKDGVIEMLLHDLKNPLNLLMNYKFFSEELLGHAANQMLNIIANISDVQRYEKTRMSFNISEVQMSNVIKNAHDQVKYLLEIKKINYQNAVNDDLNVHADEKLLERILVNLLLNAERYLEPGGDLTISAENQGDKVKILITDTGITVPEDIRKLVFDKFGLLVAKKSNPARSGNLGLSFCKIALDAHDEKIGVECNTKTTTFWFTLKLAGNINNLNTEFNNQNKQQKISLTEESKSIIAPFIKDLKLLKVYEFSTIRNIIKTLEDMSEEGIKEWLDDLKSAVTSGNENEYTRLIKIAE